MIPPTQGTEDRQRDTVYEMHLDPVGFSFCRLIYDEFVLLNGHHRSVVKHFQCETYVTVRVMPRVCLVCSSLSAGQHALNSTFTTAKPFIMPHYSCVCLQNWEV